MNMSIMICNFKRTENGKTETGIVINEGDLIIDRKGKPVLESVWNYTTFPFELCVNVQLKNPKEKMKLKTVKSSSVYGGGE